jgi:hypothetical protein
MPQFQLTRVIQEAVLEGRKPAKSIAKDIGKPYSTMLREVNPFDSSAKVGVETLLDILLSTGDTRPLEYMARQMGCKLVPLDETADTASRSKNPAAAFSLPVSA